MAHPSGDRSFLEVIYARILDHRVDLGHMPGLLTAGAAFTIDHDSPTMTTQRSINRHPRRVKVLVESHPSMTLTAQREPAGESPAADDQTEHLLYSFLIPPEPLESLNGGLQTVQRAAKMNLNLEPSPWAI